MANWTYTENAEHKNIAVSIRGGELVLRINTYANLTSQEVVSILGASAGVVLKEGIIAPATPAGGGSNSAPAATVRVWAPKTHFIENELVVSPEGELLRTLRNFESGESYVF
jgi:hypothetical protein